MQSGILILHVLVCVFLIILILLQSGREGMGVIFGGGSNSSVFGSQGAGGILVKLTTFLALLFVITSLGYNILTSTKNTTKSVLDVQFEETAPSKPTPPIIDETKKEEKQTSSSTSQNTVTKEDTTTQEKQENTTGNTENKIEEKPASN